MRKLDKARPTAKELQAKAQGTIFALAITAPLILAAILDGLLRG